MINYFYFILVFVIYFTAVTELSKHPKTSCKILLEIKNDTKLILEKIQKSKKL